MSYNRSACSIHNVIPAMDEPNRLMRRPCAPDATGHVFERKAKITEARTQATENQDFNASHTLDENYIGLEGEQF